MRGRGTALVVVVCMMMTNGYKNKADTFKSKDADPEETLLRFNKYVERMVDVFQLSRHRTAMSEPVDFTYGKKKAIMKVEGGDDMLDLFKHTEKVNDEDPYDQAV